MLFVFVCYFNATRSSTASSSNTYILLLLFITTEPGTIIRALCHSTPPSVIEVVQNAMNALGELKRFHGASRTREIASIAHSKHITVLAIRAVAAGSLCDTIDRDLPMDHPVQIDYNKAYKFRQIAMKYKMTSQTLAHRYTLSMKGVNTIVLGCKNRIELDECVKAIQDGTLNQALINEIDQALLIQKL